MPEISRFNGIVISMLFKDIKQHNKPHVHVSYAEYEATVSIDGELLGGSLPSKQFKLIQAWLILHEEELYAAWNKGYYTLRFLTRSVMSVQARPRPRSVRQ